MIFVLHTVHTSASLTCIQVSNASLFSYNDSDKMGRFDFAELVRDSTTVATPGGCVSQNGDC